MGLYILKLHPMAQDGTAEYVQLVAKGIRDLNGVAGQCRFEVFLRLLGHQSMTQANGAFIQLTLRRIPIGNSKRIVEFPHAIDDRGEVVFFRIHWLFNMIFMKSTQPEAQPKGIFA